MRHGVQHTPQSNFGRSMGEREYQRLQEIILSEKGVACTVLVTPAYVSVKAASYGEFLLAKLAIKGRVTVPIIQAPEQK